MLSPSELQVRRSLGKRVAQRRFGAAGRNQPVCQFLENIEQNWLNAIAPAQVPNV